MSEAKIPYWQKLLDPRWQKKRLEVLNRDKFECVLCEDGTATLHVHHEYYISGRQPWDYPLSAYKTLCSSCHKLTKDCATDPESWELDKALIEEGVKSLPCQLIGGLCEVYAYAEFRTGIPPGQIFGLIHHALSSSLITPEMMAHWRKDYDAFCAELKVLSANGKTTEVAS